jgi:hypothetical protein
LIGKFIVLHSRNSEAVAREKEIGYAIEGTAPKLYPAFF